MRWLTAILLLLFIGGCTSTKSGIEKVYDIRLTNADGGVIILEISLEADTQADTAAGDAPATVSPRTALGYQGGTAAIAEEGATMAMEAIKSIYEAWRDSRDQRVDNSTETTTTPPVVTPVDVNAGIASDMEGYTKMVVLPWGGDPMDPNHDRKWWGKTDEEPPAIPWQYKWNLPVMADELGDKVLFKFSDGDELYVSGNQVMDKAMTTDHKKYRATGTHTNFPIVIGARGKTYEWVRLYHSGD